MYYGGRGTNGYRRHRVAHYRQGSPGAWMTTACSYMAAVGPGVGEVGWVGDTDWKACVPWPKCRGFWNNPRLGHSRPESEYMRWHGDGWGGNVHGVLPVEKRILLHIKLLLLLLSVMLRLERLDAGMSCCIVSFLCDRYSGYHPHHA